MENMDFLKLDVNLNSINSKSYSTTLGKIVSILVYIASILIFVYYLNKITIKELQNFVTSYQFEEKSPNFTFTGYFPYIVQVQDFYSNPVYNDSIFSFHGSYFICKNKTNCQTFDLNLTKCNFTKFSNRYSEILSINVLTNSYCLNFDDNPDLNGSITISGSWAESEIRYATIGASYCINNSKCLNTSDIKDYENSGNNYLYLMFFNIDEVLNPTNYDTPSIPIMKTSYFQFNYLIFKQYNVLLTKTNISSDIGIIGQELNYTQINSNEIYFVDVYNYLDSEQLNTLGEFYIFSNQKVYFVKRYYFKLQELLTIIVSTFNIFCHFSKIILTPFIEKDFYVEIINKFIDLNEVQRKEIYMNFIEKNTQDMNFIYKTNKNIK